MKILIFTLIAILGMTTIVTAKKPEKITVRHGQQKSGAKGDLRIKFVSLVEDSRCPEGVNCIWAGNAQIKVRVTDRNGRAKEMTINTTTGPKGDQFAGYAINLTGLTPIPSETSKYSASAYTAVFSISRLYR